MHVVLLTIPFATIAPVGETRMVVGFGNGHTGAPACGVWLVCLGILCAISSITGIHAASSDTKAASSSLSSLASPNSSSSFALPKHSTNSMISASTGISRPTSVVNKNPKPGHAIALNDSQIVRSNLMINASDGLFYTFNTTKDKSVWISLSLCQGPGIPAYNTSDQDLLDRLDKSADEAQHMTLVSMYVSRDKSNPRPGPKTSSSSKYVVYAQGGWTQISLSKGSDQGVYIGVWPPEDPRNVSGEYVIQMTASTKGSLERVDYVPSLFLDDTDRENALLTSFNYTSPAPNISLIVLPTQGDFSLSSITYFNSSFCRIFDLWEEMSFLGIQPFINSSETNRNTLPRVTRGANNQPTALPTPSFENSANNVSFSTSSNAASNKKRMAALDPGDVTQLELTAVNTTDTNVTEQVLAQVRKQFHVSGLSPGTNYTAYLVSSKDVGESVQRTLFPSVKFVTKTAENCKLMYDLDFCPELAYSVPYNPNMSQVLALQALENIITQNYINFTKTLDTFPCASDKFGLYSSVSTCDDCRRSYQNWLCAVAIPRCTDLVDPEKSAASQNGTELQGLPMPANVHLYPYIVNRVGPNSSRQAYIDEIFAPGDYGELLPCLLTCEMVTRTCPPVIQWECPRWTVTAQRDYGAFADADSDGYGVGQNGGAGPDGMRFGGAYTRYVAQDAFGHVYCNAMHVDRLFREASTGAPMRTIMPSWRIWTATLSIYILSALVLG